MVLCLYFAKIEELLMYDILKSLLISIAFLAIIAIVVMFCWFLSTFSYLLALSLILFLFVWFFVWAAM